MIGLCTLSIGDGRASLIDLVQCLPWLGLLPGFSIFTAILLLSIPYIFEVFLSSPLDGGLISRAPKGPLLSSPSSIYFFFF